MSADGIKIPQLADGTDIRRGDLLYIVRGGSMGTDMYATVEMYTGSDNTFVGRSALGSLTDGLFNVGVGWGAGAVVTTGNSNTFLGHSAGNSVVTGSNNILIGHDIIGSAALVNTLNIGGALTGGVGTTKSLNSVGDFSVATNKFAIAAATGNTSFIGNLAINTNKFNVVAATGNTAIAGTLGVTSDLSVNTNKFNVTAATGNTTIAGTLGVTSDFAINSYKFNVAASSGNTSIAGTLSVAGLSSIASSTQKVWENLHGVLQIGNYSALWGYNFANTTNLSTKLYYDINGNFKFLGSDNNYGALYVQQDGVHTWLSTTNTGVDGASATVTEKMRLTKDGRLHVGSGITERTAAGVIGVVRSQSTGSYIAIETIGSGSGDGNGALFGLSDTASDGLLVWNYENSGIMFATNNSRRGGFAANGNFDINTNKFTVASSTGNTLIAGTLGVTGAISGGSYSGGAISGTTGAFSSTLGCTGNFAVNTNKFNVTATSGNTAIAGTLSTVGDFAVNTNKFTVASSTGITTVAGTLYANGNIETGAIGLTGSIVIANPINAVVFSASTNSILQYSFSGTSTIMLPVYSNTSASAANVYVTSNGTLLRSTSSRKYKENERPLEMDTAKIMDIEVVTFNMKNSGQLGHSPIAEDIALVEPNFASYDANNEPESIHTNNILYSVVVEFQKLKAEVGKLQSRIAELEAKC